MELTKTTIAYVEKLKLDDDTRQELYLHLLEAAPLRNEKALPNYIWKVCRNLIGNARHTAAKREQLLRENEAIVRDNFYEDNQAADPMDFLSGTEDMAANWDALSPLVRDTMEMYYMGDMTVEEIAERQGVRRQAVYKRLRRGRAILEGENNE